MTKSESSDIFKFKIDNSNKKNYLTKESINNKKKPYFLTLIRKKVLLRAFL